MDARMNIGWLALALAGAAALFFAKPKTHSDFTPEEWAA
jgi:hypothetical protein